MTLDGHFTLISVFWLGCIINMQAQYKLYCACLLWLSVSETKYEKTNKYLHAIHEL